MTLNKNDICYIKSNNIPDFKNTIVIIDKIEIGNDSNIFFKGLVDYDNHNSVKKVFNNFELKILHKSNIRFCQFNKISVSDFNLLKENNYNLETIGFGVSSQNDDEDEVACNNNIKVLYLFDNQIDVNNKRKFSFGKKEKINLNNFFKEIDSKQFIILDYLIEHNGQKIFMALNNEIQHRTIELKVEHTKIFENVKMESDKIYAFNFLNEDKSLIGNFIGKYENIIYFFDINEKHIFKFSNNLFIEDFIHINETHQNYREIKKEVSRDIVKKKIKELEKNIIFEKDTKLYNKRKHISQEINSDMFDKTWKKIIAIFMLDNKFEVLNNHDIKLIK